MSISLNFFSTSDNRLDVAIAAQLDGKISRSQLQKFIMEQGVVVNSLQIFKPSHKISYGLEIKLNWEENTQTLDDDLTSKIGIAFQNEDLIVVNKPPGLVVHAGAGHRGDTLADWLAANYPEQAQMQGENDEGEHDSPHLGGGMVHRLDKDTQGILLVARNLESLKFFQDQFRSREVEKRYLTILNGKLDFEIDVDGFQIRTRRNVLKQYFTLENAENPDIAAKIAKQMPLKGDWRTSHSIFKPLFYCSDTNQTIVEVQIFTGRMHQIRTQAEFLGFPLFQDPLYKVQNDVNLIDLKEKFSEKLKLTKSEIKNLNKIEFTEKCQNLFGFIDRPSFFLKSYSLKIGMKNGEIKEFGC